MKEAEIKQRLASIKISYRSIEHQPVFTMADSDAFDDVTIVKNMLIKNKKLDQYLLMMLAKDTKVDFKQLAKLLGTSRSSLRFANDDELQMELGVPSGFVSPLIIPNEFNIKFLIDVKLVNVNNLGFHAGRNDETVVIEYSDLERFANLTDVEMNEYQ